MTKEQLQQLPNEELIAMLLIEDHNIESCYRKKEEFKDNENFMDLFNTFTQNYSEIYNEIIRRMKKPEYRELSLEELKEIVALKEKQNEKEA